MNEIKIFENKKFGNVRVFEQNGEPWFVGKDVAEILGYAKPLNAIAQHVDEDDSLKQGLIDSIGRNQQTIIINESGLYSLILSSNLPSAKEFKKWVTNDILPTIRKTGGYIGNEEMFVDTYLQYAD
jgi:anti-repressor protein